MSGIWSGLGSSPVVPAHRGAVGEGRAALPRRALVEVAARFDAPASTILSCLLGRGVPLRANRRWAVLAGYLCRLQKVGHQFAPATCEVADLGWVAGEFDRLCVCGTRLGIAAGPAEQLGAGRVEGVVVL